MSPESERIEAARASLSAHAAAVFEATDVVEVRLVPSRRSTWCPAHRLPALAASLLDDDDAGQSVYAGANPRTCCGGTETGDVRLARCLSAGFDPPSRVDTRAAIEELHMPPA